MCLALATKKITKLQVTPFKLGQKGQFAVQHTAQPLSQPADEDGERELLKNCRSLPNKTETPQGHPQEHGGAPRTLPTRPLPRRPHHAPARGHLTSEKATPTVTDWALAVSCPLLPLPLPVAKAASQILARLPFPPSSSSPHHHSSTRSIPLCPVLHSARRDKASRPRLRSPAAGSSGASWAPPRTPYVSFFLLLPEKIVPLLSNAACSGRRSAMGAAGGFLGSDVC